LCAAAILGPVIITKAQFNDEDAKYFKIIKVIIIFFLISTFLSVLFSYNTNVAIFGDNFRRNGFLTSLSFIIIFFGAAKFVRFENIPKFFNSIIISSVLVGGYAIVQIQKKDFVAWSNPNAIISTLGNTNFAGAALAIFTILCFGQLFLQSINLYRKIGISFLIIILLISIKATQARQAIIISIIGITTILLFEIYLKNKKLGRSIFFLAIPISFLSILGMLQIGPFKDFLYKGSLSIRGYYWRAGIKMFQENPLFGVGIDNYGKFFKELRDVNYSLNYGFSITSTNAHNIFIQYFATGGVFVGVAYLLLQVIVLHRSVINIAKCSIEERRVVITLLAAWLAFQAQSLISIENLGGSIWGWLIGGCLIGISFSKKTESNLSSKKRKKSLELDWRSSLISILGTILSLTIIVQLYGAERDTYLTQQFTQPQSTDNNLKDLFKTYSTKALSNKFINNDYKNVVLSSMFEMGYRQQSLDELEIILKSDPRNLDTLLVLAVRNEQLRNFNKAVKYRQQISELDPWNAQNYLALGVVYKYIQDYKSMQAMLDKIMSFASKDPIATTAKNELVIPTE